MIATSHKNAKCKDLVKNDDFIVVSYDRGLSVCACADAMLFVESTTCCIVIVEADQG